MLWRHQQQYAEQQWDDQAFEATAKKYPAGMYARVVTTGLASIAEAVSSCLCWWIV
jgi:hypothetical protein